jgi:hypothetical protein
MTKKAVEFINEWAGDGHSIIREDAIPWDDLGVADLRGKLCHKFKSDTSDPKSTIFKDGVIQTEVEGVYVLDLWWAIGNRLGVGDGARMFMGRGRQAQALCEAILQKVRN